MNYLSNFIILPKNYQDMKTRQFLMIIAAMSSIVLVSCKQTDTTTKEATKEVNNDHLIMATLYQQRSA